MCVAYEVASHIPLDQYGTLTLLDLLNVSENFEHSHAPDDSLNESGILFQI